MKKIICIIITILYSICLTFNTYAESGYNMSNFNYSLISDVVEPFNVKIGKYKNKETGKIAFCVEPLVSFDRSDENYSKQLIKDIDYEYFAKISEAYDYLVSNTTDAYKKNDYYIAAQMMIWDEVENVTCTINSKDASYFGKDEIIDYINKHKTDEKQLVINDIDDGNFFEVNYIEIDDELLNDYNLVSKNIEFEFNDNKIAYTFKDINSLENEVELVPKYQYEDYLESNSFIYKSKNSQDIYSFEAEIPVKLLASKFKIRVKTGNLHLLKVDQNDEIILDSISFKLYDKNNHLIKNGNSDIFTTNNGEIKIEDKLPAGKYYFIEEENEKYVSNKEKIEFEIKINITTELRVTNILKDKTTSISFIKKNEDNEIINDTLFELYEFKEGSDEVNFIQMNENIDLYEALEADKLNNPTIKLSERYQGYLKDRIFNSNEYGYFTYDLYEDELLVKQGKVYVSNNNELTNNSFNTLKLTYINSLKTSDENVFNNLNINSKYLLCESEPSLGYEYIDEPCLIVKPNKENNYFEFINKTRTYTLRLQKVNDERTILLDGAKFEVTYYDNEGTLHTDEFITGSDIEGSFEIKQIPYNKPIIVKEIMAPDGYQIDENEYTIYPNIAYSDITFNNYRTNSAVIIPGYRIVKTCIED